MLFRGHNPGGAISEKVEQIMTRIMRPYDVVLLRQRVLPNRWSTHWWNEEITELFSSKKDLPSI